MKLKQVRVIICISIILLVCAFFVVSRGERDLPLIVKSGKLKVAIDNGHLGFMVQDDNVCGLQYEMMKAFADSLGVELVLVKENDIKKSINKLQRSSCDVVASFIPLTNEWCNEVAFTIPLIVLRQVLVQRIDSGRPLVKKQYDLANDTVYLPAHSPYKMRLLNLSDEIAAPIHIVEMRTNSIDQMMQMVVEGKIKNTVCSEQLARKIAAENPLIDISLLIGFEQQYCWAVHLDSELLLKKLNEFLEQFIETTEYWNMYRKYI